MKQLTISVITATLSSIRTLTDCLASMVSQGHPHREHIINDGAINLINHHIDKVAIFKDE